MQHNAVSFSDVIIGLIFFLDVIDIKNTHRVFRSETCVESGRTSLGLGSKVKHVSV